MITLLMVLFIVLFSISQVDLAKFKQLKAGLAEFGNGDASLIQLGQSGLLSEPELRRLDQAERALTDAATRATAARTERRALSEAQRHIEQDLAHAGLAGAARFRLEERGLVVTLITDRVLFDPGSDVLTAAGAVTVEAIGAAVAVLPNRLSIEGHTDSVPISTPRFPSNWELSTARATSVLRALAQRHGLPSARLSAAGYADQRPIASNDTAAGRASNRRVEIVVHSTLADNQEA